MVSQMKEVTDPSLLDKLNSPLTSQEQNLREVNDPRLIEKLNQPDRNESFLGKLPRNVTIGLSRLGHRTLNAPHDLIQSLERHLTALGEDVSQGMPGPQMKTDPYRPPSSYIPKQQEYNFAEMLGQTGKPTLSDTAIQKGIEYSPELATALKGFMKASPYLFKRMAGKPYGQTSDVLKEAGVTHMEAPSELIQDAKQFFKDTKANRDLIKKAEEGHIPSIHKLQSDLGRISAGYARNPFSFAERDFGRAGLSTREAILEHQQNKLKEMGMEEAADLYQKGRDQSRIYHKLKHPVRAVTALAVSQTPLPGYIKHLIKALKN